MSFVVYETSPGNYCCDVYRNDRRIITGQAYSSPDTALTHRLENMVNEMTPDMFAYRTRQPLSIRETLLSMYNLEEKNILGCMIEREGDLWRSQRRSFKLDEMVKMLEGWQV